MSKAMEWGLAQVFLGADFITPKEVMKARPSIVYTTEQIMFLVENLPPVDVLRWCYDGGYAVIPAPPTPMSLLNIREIQSAHFYSKIGGWYADEGFAREDKTSSGWLPIKKMPVLGSIGEGWNEQNQILSELERVPNAAEMSWFITTYFEVRGVRLFEDVYVRTASLNSEDLHVCVGNFSENLGIHSVWDNGPILNVGLPSARKLSLIP